MISASDYTVRFRKRAYRIPLSVGLRDRTYRIQYQWDCGMWNADDGTDTGWISCWCSTSKEAEGEARKHAAAQLKKV